MTLDNMTGITKGSYTGDDLFCKSQLITCNRVKECNGVCPFEDALKHADQTAEEQNKIDHDREWIIGCIKHDGFIKTDRFDKANQIILDALEPTEPSDKGGDAEMSEEFKPSTTPMQQTPSEDGVDFISRVDALAYPLSFDHYDKENGSREFIYGVESYREYIQHLPSVSVESKATENKYDCDLISRADALNCLDDGLYLEDIEQRIKDLPSAERVGEWQRKLVHYTDSSIGYRLKCSVCEEEWLSETNYCPNCGARMENKK